METKRLFRYVDDWIGDEYVEDVKPILQSYPVARTTRCGVRIATGYKKEKFVNLGCVKKFAHATEAEALQSYVRRKQRQVSILTHRLEWARVALEHATEEHSTPISKAEGGAAS